MVAHPQSGSSSTWFLVELEFGNVGFWGEGKTGVPGEKPLGARERTNNKLNPHMASTPGFEHGPHWWEVSTLLGCFRLSDSGEDAKEKGTRKVGPDYLGAWNRLALYPLRHPLLLTKLNSKAPFIRQTFHEPDQTQFNLRPTQIIQGDWLD